MILQIIIVTIEHLWVASLYKCHIMIVVTPSQMFRLSVVRYNLGSMANVIISHNHCLLSLSATKVTIQCLKQPPFSSVLITPLQTHFQFNEAHQPTLTASLFPTLPQMQKLNLCRCGEPGFFSHVSSVKGREEVERDLNCMWTYPKAQNMKMSIGKATYYTYQPKIILLIYVLYHLWLCLISLFWLVVYAIDTKIKIWLIDWLIGWLIDWLII